MRMPLKTSKRSDLPPYNLTLKPHDLKNYFFIVVESIKFSNFVPLLTKILLQ